MKFLEYTRFDAINNVLLRGVNQLGERTIKGCLEAYSCKHTGTNEKLAIRLENEILDSCMHYTEDQYLLDNSTQKTMIYPLLGLYHMYPDYDFCAVRAHKFCREEGLAEFKQIFYNYMFEAVSKEWENLYRALDEVVKLPECEIYSYTPSPEADPFLLEKGAIWSYTLFFYNKNLKRVASFRFSCVSDLLNEGFSELTSYEEDGEIYEGMDI